MPKEMKDPEDEMAQVKEAQDAGKGWIWEFIKDVRDDNYDKSKGCWQEAR